MTSVSWRLYPTLTHSGHGGQFRVTGIGDGPQNTTNLFERIELLSSYRLTLIQTFGFLQLEREREWMFTAIAKQLEVSSYSIASLFSHLPT